MRKKAVSPKVPKTPKVIERSEAELSVDDGNKKPDATGKTNRVKPVLDGDGVAKMSKKPHRIMHMRRFADRSCKLYVQDGSHHAVDDEWCSANNPRVNKYVMLRDGKLVCMTYDEAVPLSK